MELFINNKYTTIYYAIIEKAKAINRLDEYTEKHHIIPKSIGGANEASNLVRLTAREHFICHMLLPKMVPYEYRAKMTYAAWAMTMLKRPGQARYKVTASQYEAIKKQRAAMLLEPNKNGFRRMKLSELKGHFAGAEREVWVSAPSLLVRREIVYNFLDNLASIQL